MRTTYIYSTYIIYFVISFIILPSISKDPPLGVEFSIFFARLLAEGEAVEAMLDGAVGPAKAAGAVEAVEVTDGAVGGIA